MNTKRSEEVPVKENNVKNNSTVRYIKCCQTGATFSLLYYIILDFFSE